jgi:hypothetical protein
MLVDDFETVFFPQRLLKKKLDRYHIYYDGDQSHSVLLEKFLRFYIVDKT